MARKKHAPGTDRQEAARSCGRTPTSTRFTRGSKTNCSAAKSRAEHGRRVAGLVQDPDVSYQNRQWARMESEGRLDEMWRAHSYSDGALDVRGRRVELIEDPQLAELLRPWLRSRGRRLHRTAAHRRKAQLAVR